MPFPARPSMRLSMRGLGLLEIFIRTGIYKIPFFRQGGGRARATGAPKQGGGREPYGGTTHTGAARAATTLRGQGYRDATHPDYHTAW